MIQITPGCPHGAGDLVKGIVMRVILGEIKADTAIVCPYCNKVIFYVEEIVFRAKLGGTTPR